jgi:5-methylcytosine-specific restriction protein A
VELRNAGRMRWGGNGVAELWEEFSHRGDELKLIASAIRAAAGDQVSIAVAEQDEGVTEVQEGRLLTRMHRVRERNRELVKRKRDAVLRETGRLACEVCGFDFNDRYGEHSGSNLTFESGLGFRGDSGRASLADANRHFPFCDICR